MKAFVLLALCSVAIAEDAHAVFEGVFNSVDTNGNNRVELSEFQTIFDNDDLDNDGQLPVSEYIQATGAVGTGPATFFAVMDPNNDGTIHRTELPAILANFDLDGNGTVTKQEFIIEYEKLYDKVLELEVSVGK